MSATSMEADFFVSLKVKTGELSGYNYRNCRRQSRLVDLRMSAYYAYYLISDALKQIKVFSAGGAALTIPIHHSCKRKISPIVGQRTLNRNTTRHNSGCAFLLHCSAPVFPPSFFFRPSFVLSRGTVGWMPNAHEGRRRRGGGEDVLLGAMDGNAQSL